MKTPITLTETNVRELQETGKTTVYAPISEIPNNDRWKPVARDGDTFYFQNTRSEWATTRDFPCPFGAVGSGWWGRENFQVIEWAKGTDTPDGDGEWDFWGCDLPNYKPTTLEDARPHVPGTCNYGGFQLLYQADGDMDGELEVCGIGWRDGDTMPAEWGRFAGPILSTTITRHAEGWKWEVGIGVGEPKGKE